MSSTATPKGIAAKRVGELLADAVAAARPPFAYRLIAGGRSNLTYEVTDAAGARSVLRRPPLGEVLQSAHDVIREARIVHALEGTAVPVPEVLVVCDDPHVTGAPFAVTRFVEGAIVRDEAQATELSVTTRAAAGPAAAATLAALHAVDPGAVGLGSLGKREDYVGRQLRRWLRQWEASRDREAPEVVEAHRRLAAHVPPQVTTALVHGDFRLDNLVLDPEDGTVRAVLDWELCTLGDPRADLGTLLVNWAAPGEATGHLLSGTPSAAGGFCDRQALIAAYGGEPEELCYFVALGLWKLACIAEGIRARCASGAMGHAEGLEPAELARKVVALASRALDILDGGDIAAPARSAGGTGR